MTSKYFLIISKRRYRLAVLCVLVLTFLPVSSTTAQHAGLGELPVPDSVQSNLATPGFALVAAGGQHTCAITPGGAFKCWGQNEYGQLGDGTVEDRFTPVYVSGLTSGVAAVAVGDLHTCALTSGGGVKCWGNGWNGQLGDGTTTFQQKTPVDVVGLSSDVAAIAAGQSHTCALTSAGAVKCWGDNAWGQLGDGTPSYSGNFQNTPVDVIGLSGGIAMIAGGVRHTCAVASIGSVKCWGNNESGQLGDGTYNSSTVPVDVVNLPDSVTGITLGYDHTCALISGDTVMCWGNNDSGQLGNGTGNFSSTPVAVLELSTAVTRISAGNWHTCAITTLGTAKCWGANQVGQLGDGTRLGRNIPGDVFGLPGYFIDIATGYSHTCALTSEGVIKCWGWNYFGQLGNGITPNYPTAKPVTGLTSGVTSIVSGDSHTCAITSAGVVKCWGGNDMGQLGDGSWNDRMIPLAVFGLSGGVKGIATQLNHTCALISNGGVKCWGNNEFGQVGNGTLISRNTPASVIGLPSGVAAIATGGFHTCALTTGGGVKCWGKNSWGQLGNGTLTDSTTPVPVSGLASGVTSIAAGSDHTCAVTSAGKVKCWGHNYAEQLGDGTRDDRTTPVTVIGLPNGISRVAAGWDGTCAVTTNGVIYCWGNDYPIVGGIDAENAVSAAPQNILTDAKAVTVGSFHWCALTSSGGAKCWGDNWYGQLGVGSSENTYYPANVTGLTTKVMAIAAGGKHTCAVTSWGEAKCWGNNYYGQLGNGTAIAQTVPVNVYAQTFVDVPLSHPYYSDIEILYVNGLTGGCQVSPPKFCPDKIMNRAEAAAFNLRAHFGPSYIPPAATHIFVDDWSKGPWAEPWAEGMKLNGYSAGCLANPPKYCPWDLIPREQAVIFILKLKYGKLYTPPAATGTMFADMTDTSFYATAWAEQAYIEGLIPSCGTSGGKPKICPKTLVSRGLAAYMIVQAKDLTMP